MIDIDALRKDLIDYFGSAMMVSPAAVMEVIKAESCSNQELIKTATQYGIDLSEYEINNQHTR